MFVKVVKFILCVQLLSLICFLLVMFHLKFVLHLVLFQSHLSVLSANSAVTMVAKGWYLIWLLGKLLCKNLFGPSCWKYYGIYKQKRNYICVHVYTTISILYRYAYLYMYVHIYVYVFLCFCVFLFVCIYRCVFVCICTCVFMHIGLG